MTFIVSKISDYGAPNPIVARLVFQVPELLEWSSLSKEKQDEVIDIYWQLKEILISCYSSFEKLKYEDERTCSEIVAKGDPNVISLPYIPELEMTVHAIMYQTKNFLRELVKVLNVFFGTNFLKGSQFGRRGKGGDSDVVKWALEKFGSDSTMSRCFREAQIITAEFIEKRNAIEHPKDAPRKILEVHNYMMVGVVRQPPVWFLVGDKPVLLLPDLEDIIRWLLDFSDTLLALCVEETKHNEMVTIRSIPEDERDPECPKRFRATLTEEFLEKHPIPK